MARGSTERVLLVSQVIFGAMGGGGGSVPGKVGARWVRGCAGAGVAHACAGGRAAPAGDGPRHGGSLRVLASRQAQQHARVPIQSVTDMS